MFEVEINYDKILSRKERNSVKYIRKFIDSDLCYDGKILIIYGLRHTGKTSMLEHTLTSYRDKVKFAFLEASVNDTMETVEQKIEEAKKDGASVVCIDEITKVSDFQMLSSILSDRFAKAGIRVIITGNDSLGFNFAQNSELFDRCKMISTTHISFTEYCRILGINDIDDYIEYGGLMCQSKSEAFVKDYNSVRKYLDSAVAENIYNSIKASDENSNISVLSFDELRAVIAKAIEKYSGKFNVAVAQNILKKESVNSPLTSMEKDGYPEALVESLNVKDKEIIKDLVEEINADKNINCKINENMLQEIETYLIEMDVLSAVKKVEFVYDDAIGWRTRKTSNDFYIIQPAVKYHHLSKCADFIDDHHAYEHLDDDLKTFMKDKLKDIIKEDMIEQIIAFDLKNEFGNTPYDVFKTEFYNNSNKFGEYNILIYDKSAKKYWAFEVKHTTKSCYKHHKYLNNEFIRDFLDRNYGSRENAAVLYRGASCEDSDDGSLYLNITEFLLAVEKHHDMDKAMSELAAGISQYADKVSIASV